MIKIAGGIFIKEAAGLMRAVRMTQTGQDPEAINAILRRLSGRLLGGTPESAIGKIHGWEKQLSKLRGPAYFNRDLEGLVHGMRSRVKRPAAHGGRLIPGAASLWGSITPVQ